GVLIALGFVALAMINHTTSSFTIAAILFVNGITRSMHLTLINTIAFADVPPNKMRDANTLGAILMQMNRGLGITLSALAIAAAAFILGQSAGAPNLQTFTLSMMFMGAVALVSIYDSLMLSKEDGDSVLNKRKAKKARQT
ncbi:multidrug efflux MFS transporter, partial [Alteromonadaceae bacterium A_SAG6]|nr:multidrug efflux MFS transporter [Alteromonadaceae bacterium A_SAG6]